MCWVHTTTLLIVIDSPVLLALRSTESPYSRVLQAARSCNHPMQNGMLGGQYWNLGWPFLFPTPYC